MLRRGVQGGGRRVCRGLPPVQVIKDLRHGLVGPHAFHLRAARPPRSPRARRGAAWGDPRRRGAGALLWQRARWAGKRAAHLPVARCIEAEAQREGRRWRGRAPAASFPPQLLRAPVHVGERVRAGALPWGALHTQARPGLPAAVQCSMQGRRRVSCRCATRSPAQCGGPAMQRHGQNGRDVRTRFPIRSCAPLARPCRRPSAPNPRRIRVGDRLGQCGSAAKEGGAKEAPAARRCACAPRAPAPIRAACACPAPRPRWPPSRRTRAASARPGAAGAAAARARSRRLPPGARPLQPVTEPSSCGQQCLIKALAPSH